MIRRLPYRIRRAMSIAAIEGLSPEDQTIVDQWVAEFTTCEEAADYIEIALEQAF